MQGSRLIFATVLVLLYASCESAKVDRRGFSPPPIAQESDTTTDNRDTDKTPSVAAKDPVSDESAVTNAVEDSSSEADSVQDDFMKIYTDLARAHAPRVFFHTEEEHFPSSVEFFLESVDIGTTYMTTKETLSCPSCINPQVLKGQSLSEAPVYAEIISRTEEKASPQTTDVIYWMFYPYNRGKSVCIGLIAKFVGCVGGRSTFGHHVGDWEHITVRFIDEVPTQIALSQHSDGDVLNFNDSKIKLADKTHPIVYAADGSHRLYATAGDHKYKDLPNGDSLVDKTSSGKAWDTWSNLVVFEFQTKGSYAGDLAWLNYEQRWGNPKEGCAVSETISGECILGDGPSGPMMKAVNEPGFTGFE